MIKLNIFGDISPAMFSATLFFMILASKRVNDEACNFSMTRLVGQSDRLIKIHHDSSINNISEMI